MVGNRYVAPSFFQYAAPLLQGYVGKKQLEKAEAEQLNLAKAIREQGASEVADILNTFQGRQAKPAPAGYELVDAGTPAVAPNPQLALAKATTAGPYGRALLPTILERAMPAPKKPMVVAPGGALVDESGRLIYQAPYKPEAGDGVGQEGGYNKKGDWITPNNTFIGKSEVAKDREIAFTADQVRQGLKQITSEDVKKASSVFGNLTTGGPLSYAAKQLGSEAVSAQTKINASSVMQILQNLPPGPASDKDIENARSTFPGYGNERALNDWIKNTRETLDRKVNSLNQKYGSENWYGNVGLSSTPSPAGQQKEVDFNSLPKRK